LFENFYSVLLSVYLPRLGIRHRSLGSPLGSKLLSVSQEKANGVHFLNVKLIVVMNEERSNVR